MWSNSKIKITLNFSTMPLVIISGFPGSGKSYRALQLREYFLKNTARKVVVLSENDIVKTHDVYSGKCYNVG